MRRARKRSYSSSYGSYSDSTRGRSRASRSSSSSYSRSRSSPSIFRKRAKREGAKAAKPAKEEEEDKTMKMKVSKGAQKRVHLSPADKQKEKAVNGKKAATPEPKGKVETPKAKETKASPKATVKEVKADQKEGKVKEKDLKQTEPTDEPTAEPKAEPLAPKEAQTEEKAEISEVKKKGLEAAPSGEKEEKPPKEVLDKGGIHALQQSLLQESQNLQLMLLQAKRDLDDRRDTQEKQERREKEYYRGDYGEPLGPENRLLLEEALGQGAFSTVYRCRDMKAEGEKYYAVKFIRKNSVLRSATEAEVKLMRRLRTQASELDAEGARCFLGLAGPEVMEHDGHLALCFQLQRCDLRSALKRWGQGKGLPLQLVRNYARNVFLALRALKRVSIVHSDLKPDNLLVSMDKLSVKLSDFGSAMEVKDRLRPEKACESLQPRFYRAPEVILGQPYDTQIDVWSAGCTVFEMVTGKFLFMGRDNNEMLFRMMKHLGAFSRSFCGCGALSHRHFRREDGAFRVGADANGEPLRFIGREDFPRPPRPILEELQEPLKVGEAGQLAARALVELILAAITPDPGKRVDPDAALSTSFLRPSGTRVQ